MSSTQKIIDAIYKDPPTATLQWRFVENLLVSLGCDLIEGNGSRVAFIYKGHKTFFHRPHPQKEAKRYQILAVRQFIELIGDLK
jgi:HicA toxin of bacterial toxin-antitoxin,